MSNFEDLRCRDEILQAMFWMRGENLHAQADASILARFLAVERPLLEEQLAALDRSGHVRRRNGGYVLTELGQQEGGRRFADEFSGLQSTAHGDCGPECPTCKGVPRDACLHCAPEVVER